MRRCEPVLSMREHGAGNEATEPETRLKKWRSWRGIVAVIVAVIIIVVIIIIIITTTAIPLINSPTS